ncbi:hypothetical protein [Paenibacillus chitinolyticus]
MIRKFASHAADLSVKAGSQPKEKLLFGEPKKPAELQKKVIDSKWKHTK